MPLGLQALQQQEMGFPSQPPSYTSSRKLNAPPDLNPCLWALWVGSFYLLHLFLSDPGGEKEGKKSLCKEQRGGGCITW